MSDHDEPPVIGGGVGPAPMPTQTEEWEGRYVAQMVKRGIHHEDAWLCCKAGEHDYTSNPEDAANEELSYWTDDGDE